MSLRFRVIAAAVVVAIAPVLFVALFGIFERDIASGMRARLEVAVLEAARSIDNGGDPRAIAEHGARAEAIRVRIVRDGQVVADADLDRGADSLHRIGQWFFGPDGAPTLREFDETLGPLGDRPEVATAGFDRPVTGCRTSVTSKLLVCHSVLVASDGTVIYAQESSRRAARVLYDLRYQLLRLSIAMLPFAIVISLLLGRGIVKPIVALGAQARTRAKDPSGKARLDEVGDAEIRDLARAFNELLFRLEERQRQNETFTADLVHEIKNPLATVRAAADAIEKGGIEGARGERLSRALRDAGKRLDSIVSQFLELARAEGGLSADERSDIDLAALTRAVAEAAAAKHEKVELVLSASEPAIVRGVEHGLESTIRNLVENAFSFAAARGDEPAKVTVVVEAGETEVELRVEDSGPGIPSAELPKVFDRFFTSRGRERGTGLGLALVKATVEAHGGGVHATSEPERGAVFVVRLPRVAGVD